MRVGRELAHCPHLPHQRAVGSWRTPLRGRRDTRCLRCTAGLELRAPALPLLRPRDGPAPDSCNSSNAATVPGRPSGGAGNRRLKRDPGAGASNGDLAAKAQKPRRGPSRRVPSPESGRPQGNDERDGPLHGGGGGLPGNRLGGDRTYGRPPAEREVRRNRPRDRRDRRRPGEYSKDPTLAAADGARRSGYEIRGAALAAIPSNYAHARARGCPYARQAPNAPRAGAERDTHRSRS